MSILFGESLTFTHWLTRTATIFFPLGRSIFWNDARRYSFKLCAAMLLSKQLLWHFLVVVGLKRLFSAQYPLTETDAKR
ncbi:hypothetical protein FNW02_14220 [Komarekiella sp. 'clone 1']|uniref:Uncharacterized protein n=1 Tax=Komarekiella delphini-convector SJRDD-AB1 TaxID=2593771 RepID=A0AA40SX78_9NOST|nr:hypothetical protein [Komarekiella delphini-convector SJRDD-AB1]